MISILLTTARSLGKVGWMTSGLLAILTQFTYVALVVILMLAGMGVPIPEDIPLVISGYLCHEKESPIAAVQIDEDGDGFPETQVAAPAEKPIPKVHWMIVAGMAGVLLGDSIVFSIGRRGIESNNLVARHLRKVMHSKRREKVERHFARHGNLTVFVGRFMPGFRSLVFAFAGLSKMSYLRFLLIDGIAALISVPAFILLGYFLAPKWTQLLAWIDRVKLVVIPVVLAAAAITIALYIVRKRRRRLAVGSP